MGISNIKFSTFAKASVDKQNSKLRSGLISSGSSVDKIQGVKGGSSSARTMAELMAGAGKSMTSLQKGAIIEGIVKKLTPQEILLDIGFKSDALVIEYDKKNLENLLAVIKVGDRVKASVISCESEDGYPVVSLRRMLEDSIYHDLEEKYSKGGTVEVEITDSTKGGFFVATEKGIKGFLPASQVLDEKDLLGKKISVQVIELDRKNKRVIFSQKANIYTTSQAGMEKYVKKGEVVETQVSNVSPYGVYVTMSPAPEVIIEGFIHISEVSHQRIENLQELYKKGDKIKAEVLEVDKDSRRVNLSVKRLEKDIFEDVKNKYQKEQKVKGVISEVRLRGVTLEIEPGIFGFIPASKLPSQTVYKTGETIDVEVSDFDMKRHVIVVTPVLKEKPMLYR
ncbi:MAG: S1 RNA-binding domain-containing protein [Armatimonadetes bacterium]|nr:MAG: S1 RNA-binding domain-containing protein [Armatimonadota bacterium]